MPRGWPKGKPRGIKPIVRRKQRDDPTFITADARFDPTWMPYADWPVDVMEADDEFIERARRGLVLAHGMCSHSNPEQEFWLRLELAIVGSRGYPRLEFPEARLAA